MLPPASACDAPYPTDLVSVSSCWCRPVRVCMCVLSVCLLAGTECECVQLVSPPTSSCVGSALPPSGVRAPAPGFAVWSLPRHMHIALPCSCSVRVHVCVCTKVRPATLCVGTVGGVCGCVCFASFGLFFARVYFNPAATLELSHGLAASSTPGTCACAFLRFSWCVCVSVCCEFFHQ